MLSPGNDSCKKPMKGTIGVQSKFLGGEGVVDGEGVAVKGA